MDLCEDSFTLSSFDFDSSFELYSSDDEHQLDQRNYRDHDMDTYIELELRSAAPRVDGDDDELRISFSAVVPFPGFFPSSTNSAIIVSSKPSFSTCEDQLIMSTVDLIPEEVIKSTPSTPIKRRLIGSRYSVKLVPLAWTRFPPSTDHINGWDLVGTRKASPAVNGGITKLLLKLRSIIISGFGNLRASLAQAVNNQAPPNGQRLTSMKPFERRLALCKPSEPLAAVRTNVGSSSEVRPSTLKVTEMKFETMRKLLGNAVSQLKNNGSKSNRMNKSCPTSVKSSPVHQLGDASLVHAAIAHCKKSFGQTDDFSF
ncbi:hypothetical protein ACS0TY_015559 [Phlomoides rotata]